MSKYEIPYINLIIRTFAERFQMTRQAAYAYLQDPEETVDDLIVKCQQQGGTLVC